MNTNFNVLNRIKKTNLYVEKLIMNFPKKEYILKNNLEKSMFRTIELVFTCNIQDSLRIKEKFFKDLVVELAMINYYVEFAYERKFVSKKQREVVGKYLIEIRKMIYGVIQNERNKLSKDNNA